MTCDSKLGELPCLNTNEHKGGEERRGCVFASSTFAYDAKEAFKKGDNGD